MSLPFGDFSHYGASAGASCLAINVLAKGR